MLVLVEAILVFVLIILLTLAVTRTLSRPEFKRRFEDDLFRQLHGSEFADDLVDTQLHPSTVDGKTWSGYWLKLVLTTGRHVRTPQGPANFVALVAVVSAGVAVLLSGTPVMGLVVPLLILAVLRFLLLREGKKRKKVMDEQLPGLISALRANIQAAGTPQMALFAVADDTPAPLGDEIRIVKNQMLVNVPLDVALQGMAARVDSREAKFLGSSIEIAVNSGADLDPQLKVIGEVVVQRARIANKIRAAVNSAKPTIAAAGIAVPLMLANSMRNPDNRAFWTSSFGGMVTLIAVGVLYFLGLFISRLLIKQVENT